MEYNSAIKKEKRKKKIMNFAGKWIERQIWYIVAYMWILAAKSLITKLEYVEPQGFGIE